MKRIGLITLYNSNNYGAILQAYALYRTIEKNDCSCQIIQHDRFDSVVRKEKKNSRIKKITGYAYLLMKHPVSAIRDKFMGMRSADIAENRRQCLAFRKEFFTNLSPHFYSTYESIVNDPPLCDGLICGSDQIWNPSRFALAAPFFLDFGDEKLTRIAYAPSLASKKIPEEMAEQYCQWIKKFDYVSVREKSGANAIDEVSGIRPECLLDPTFLLDQADWDRIAVTDTDRNKKFIFCYFLGRENFIAASKAIEKLAKQLDAEIIVLPPDRHYVPKKYSAQNIKYGPRAFLGYIRDAEYVVTDSFHGTALSINYRKQFCVFKAREKTAAYDKFVRMEEILNSFGLNDRVFTSKDYCCIDHIDYSQIEDKIVKRIDESKEYLKTALEHVEETVIKSQYPKIATKEECTGCTACAAVCRANAIEMQQNSLGFWYPHIDMGKCVKCGACYKVCPIFHCGTENNIARYMAIYSLDKQFRAEGSSGNAFGLIVDAMNQAYKDAVVYGAAFEDDYYSVSCKSSNDVDMKKLQKSKYLESYMGETIRRIQENIKDGKMVLFCGTPCQVMGVRSAIGYRDNLLLVDFICHGTPSSTWYEKYIKVLEERYKSKVINVDFRPKLVGWAPHCIYIKFDNGREYIKTVFADPYLTDFSRNKHLRRNCYSCNRILSSQADLTIGDYWAARVYKNVENTNEGISIVRAQTKLGEVYLEKIKNTPQVFAKELEEHEVDRTFIYRKRSIPASCEEQPEEFPMHPKRNLKDWARYFYYEGYVKHIKYHVKEK